jgi:hypothetical protein
MKKQIGLVSLLLFATVAYCQPKKPVIKKERLEDKIEQY